MVITVTANHSNFYKDKLRFMEYPQDGYHEKTGVKCKFLFHQVLDKINDNVKIDSRSLYRSFVDEKTDQMIVSNIKQKHRSITLGELEMFYEIKSMQRRK